MTIRTHSPRKSAWKSYSEWLSRVLEGRSVEVEISGAGLVSRMQAESVPLRGLIYDSRSDVFQVILEGLDHVIRRPREFLVVEGPHGLESFEIEDGERCRHAVTLKQPLALPAPPEE